MDQTTNYILPILNTTHCVVEKAFGTEGISKWRKLTDHAAAYARATTLHGFAYMGETERHWIEKYFLKIVL